MRLVKRICYLNMLLKSVKDVIKSDIKCYVIDFEIEKNEN